MMFFISRLLLKSSQRIDLHKKQFALSTPSSVIKTRIGHTFYSLVTKYVVCLELDDNKHQATHVHRLNFATFCFCRRFKNFCIIAVLHKSIKWYWGITNQSYYFGKGQIVHQNCNFCTSKSFPLSFSRHAQKLIKTRPYVAWKHNVSGLKT